MGKLLCIKCKAHAEGKTRDDADVLIDHAATSIKCSGKQSYMQWTDSESVQGKVTSASVDKAIKKQLKKV